MDKVLKEMEKIVKDITQYVNTNSRISISKYIFVPFNEEKRNERKFHYDECYSIQWENWSINANLVDFHVVHVPIQWL